MKATDIIQFVKRHPAGKVKIAFTDIDGILRGKPISTAKFLSSVDGLTGFCDVIFGWILPMFLMITPPIPDGIQVILIFCTY